MKDQKEMISLAASEMMNITGGDGHGKPSISTGNSGHCYIDGEIIFETICTDNAQCTSLYGKDASCYIL